jgi:hypothetical protein
MQTLAAYLLFVLVLAALGLSIILSGIILLVIYEGARWMKLLLHEHAWWHGTLRRFSIISPRRYDLIAIAALRNRP